MTAVARDALGELERRFGDRSFDGRAGAARGGGAARPGVRGRRRSPAPLLGVADDVLAGAYPIAPVVQLGVVGQAAALRLPRELAPDHARRVAQLERRIAEVRGEARCPRPGLVDDIAELRRGTATAAWRGPARLRAEPARTLIYRRRGDGRA